MTRSDGLLDRLKDPSGLQGLFDPNLDPILDPYIFRHAHLGVYVGGLKDPPRGLKDPLTSKRSLLVWEARADLVRAPSPTAVAGKCMLGLSSTDVSTELHALGLYIFLL
jgi:hypothetical protein